VAVVEGTCRGRIARERKGTGGFGYDPLFIVPEYHATFGELSSAVKHALSHRGRAMAKLRPILRKWLT
jgi:XTP/dITP diphosphohydrolase